VPTARITIESIAAGGDGIGRADGLAVFVPRAAPGDVADVEYEQRGRLARGRLLALAEPAPSRVEPPCPHYTQDRCGGCQIQHMSIDAQRDAKRHIIRDALARIGKRDVPLPDVVPSPESWRYRSKLTLALRRVRGEWIAGLHPFDDPAGVFALDDCPITAEPTLAVWRSILAHRDLLPSARELRGAVRVGASGASFVLEGGTRWPGARAFADAVPALDAVWWVPDEGRRQLVADRRVEGAPGASFAQVNVEAAALLHGHVLGLALGHEPRVVVDAYAGAGATAIPLAERGARVTAIELDRDAVAWMRPRLVPPSRAVAARVERALERALPADVVLLIPPRAGVHDDVTRALERTTPRPRAVIYVSCNPATLARDLALLPSYGVRSLTGFDLFPQTAHVETVCELVPEDA
jgi:23S rRNA (uracil1939-C5)-methyltransferase